jgi:hypothetical protein
MEPAPEEIYNWPPKLLIERQLVAVELTIVPAPEPPNRLYTTPVFAPSAQRLTLLSLVAPRILTALKLVVVVVVSIAPVLSTRPMTLTIVAVEVPETAAVPTGAS